jgi:hypothetical protein
MTKLKSYKFLFDEEDEVLFDLIGICSSSSLYKVVWDFNRTLRMDLACSTLHFSVIDKKGIVSTFPYHIQEIPEEMFSVYLIQNTFQGKALIPELKQIDYFLFYVNNQTVDMNVVCSTIKSKMKMAQAAYIFDPSEYPSTKNLIFDKHEKN